MDVSKEVHFVVVVVVVVLVVVVVVVSFQILCTTHQNKKII